MLGVQKHSPNGTGEKHIVLGHRKLNVVALPFHDQHFAAKPLDERRVVGSHEPVRQESAFSGLEMVGDEYEYVVLHDGARPLVSPDLI